MKPALLLLATLPLAGCFLDRDKSPAEREQQMQVVHAINAGEVVMAPAVVAAPACVEEFRVRRCSNGEAIPW